MKNRIIVITGAISGIGKKTAIELHDNISNWKNISKKKMFGGTSYLLKGNMVADIHNIRV